VPNHNVALFAAALFLANVAHASAQDDVIGRVVAVTLTQCDFKPRTCEGTLSINVGAAGKTKLVIVNVGRGTSITKSGQDVLLPTLRGQIVDVPVKTEHGARNAIAVRVVAH